MKEQNKKILKRIVNVILIIILIPILAIIGVGNYFVNYAILRTGNGGDREVKNTDSIEVANIDDEAANCKKEKLIIHNAGHTESKYKEPETYYNKIFTFLENTK